jgi:CRISPR system Cascade subunit CasE
MSGYLHRIHLKRGLSTEALARALPTNTYGEHQLVWRWFGGQGVARDFLFRREQQGHWPFFYVLSRREATDPSGLWEIETRPFAPKLAGGEVLSFVLRANPVRVRKVSDDPGVKARRRDDVVMDLKRTHRDGRPCPPLQDMVQEASAAWLAERAESCGFKVESLRADGYRQQRWHKPGKGQPITLSTVDFTGLLRVVDPQVFTERLFQGIGPAKSFGCGLLLVRRLRLD